MSIWPFLKQFSRNKMICQLAIFLVFFSILKKMAKFQQNIQHFMIFQKNLICFGKFYLKMFTDHSLQVALVGLELWAIAMFINLTLQVPQSWYQVSQSPITYHSL
jgi:hypothetical protein